MKVEKEIEVEEDNMGTEILYMEFDKTLSELRNRKAADWIAYQVSY